ncbi:MAG: hypothetical protein WA126_14605, partial [Thermodesulfovibrionales bacterium]
KDNQRRLLALMDLLSEQPELRFNTVSHTAGMDLIENVLKRDVMYRDEMGKDILSGSMYAREARPHITKGGCYALDDLCDSLGSLAVGAGERYVNYVANLRIKYLTICEHGIYFFQCGKDYLQPNKKSKISQKGGAIGYSDLSLAVPYCLFKKGILSVGSEGDWVIAEQRGRTKNFA